MLHRFAFISFAAVLLILVSTELISSADNPGVNLFQSDTLICGSKVFDHWLEAVNHAKESIFIATYKFKSQSALEALLCASRRGVKVSLLIDSFAAKDANSLVGNAVREGIEVRLWRSTKLGKLHTKLYIFDETSVILGSFNLTESAADENTELLFYSRDNRIVEQSLKCWKSLFDAAEN